MSVHFAEDRKLAELIHLSESVLLECSPADSDERPLLSSVSLFRSRKLPVSALH